MDLKEFKARVRTLATTEETESGVVSCYLNISKGPELARRVLQKKAVPLRASLAKVEQRTFDELIQQIDDAVALVASETQGVAAFARGGSAPFFMVLHFQVPLPNSVGLGSTPNIFHLVELKDTYHRYVVLIRTKDSVRILEVNLGAVTAQVLRERPELRERVGREWAKHRYQHHRREEDRQFLAETIRILNERMAAGGYQHLMLAGDPRVVAAIRADLPKTVARYLVDSVPASRSDRISDVVAATLSTFIEEEQRESRVAVEELCRQIRTDGLGLAGETETLRALELGQVDVLVLAKGYDSPAREYMLRLAAATDSDVEFVEHSDVLMQLGGVGCLLRYRIPGVTPDQSCSEGYLTRASEGG